MNQMPPLQPPLPLERVFPEGHRYYDVLWYDYQAGQYYDRAKDMFVPYEDLKGYGMPCP